MTFAEREQIFSKDVLFAEDIMKLFECDRQKAYSIIRKIKSNSENRLDEQGKCHIEDYFECFKIPLSDRYTRRNL